MNGIVDWSQLCMTCSSHTLERVTFNLQSFCLHISANMNIEDVVNEFKRFEDHVTILLISKKKLKGLQKKQRIIDHATLDTLKITNLTDEYRKYERKQPLMTLFSRGTFNFLSFIHNWENLLWSTSIVQLLNISSSNF